jgi:hypothetical protein
MASAIRQQAGEGRQEKEGRRRKVAIGIKRREWEDVGGRQGRVASGQTVEIGRGEAREGGQWPDG